MPLTDIERSAGEKTFWKTANVQGLVAGTIQPKGVLETLATFHNTSLIEIELAASALGEPVSGGPLELASPLRGLRSKDEILYHPVIAVLEKDIALLKDAGAPPELRKKGLAVVDLLRTQYRKNHEPEPFDANAARQAWAKALGLEDNPNRTNPGELLFRAAAEKKIVPNFNAVLRDYGRFKDKPIEEIWTELTTNKAIVHDQHLQFTKFLEDGYADLEKIAVRPLIDETMAWYKSTTELKPADLKKITEFLNEAQAYAKTLRNLERDTLLKNLQTVGCHIIGARALDGLIHEGKGKVKELAKKVSEGALEAGLEHFGVAKAALTLLDTLAVVGAIAINKEGEYAEMKETVSEFIETMADKTFEKVVGENWRTSRLQRYISAANEQNRSHFAEIQQAANRTYLAEVIKDLSPAGRTTAALAAKLCLVASMNEGRLAATNGDFKAVAGDNTAAAKTNALASEYGDWMYALREETAYTGIEQPDDPLDDIQYELERTGAALPEETPLVHRSQRYRATWEAKELLDQVLASRDKATSHIGERVVNWIERREAIRKHFNPYRSKVAFHKTGLLEIYRKAETDIGQDASQRDRDIPILQAVAAALATDPENARAVLNESKEESKRIFLEASKRLPAPDAVAIISEPFRQSFDNLAASSDGITALERIAKAGKLDCLNRSWLIDEDFLSLPVEHNDLPMVARVVMAGGEDAVLKTPYWSQVAAAAVDQNGRPLMFDLIDRRTGKIDYPVAPYGVTDQDGVSIAAYAAKTGRLHDLGAWQLQAQDFTCRHHLTGRTAWHEIFTNRDEALKIASAQINLPWNPWALLAPDVNGKTPLDHACENNVENLIPQQVRVQAMAIQHGWGDYEQITAALHKSARHEQLTAHEESFFKNGDLRPEIIALANQEISGPRGASILEMLEAAEQRSTFDQRLENAFDHDQIEAAV